MTREGSPISGLIVCAPLRIEARAVRRGIGDGGEVRRTGMGSRDSQRRARLLQADQDGFGTLAVAGTGGGLVPGMRPGDLVVGTSAEDGDGVVACPSAPLLAGELRRAGLRVHTGPIATVPKIVRGSERGRLAASGAIAADLESAMLLRAAAGRPAIVVRAISDVPGQPLPGGPDDIDGPGGRDGWLGGTAVRLGLDGLRGGTAALRSLRLAGPALTRWAAACGARQVLLAAPRSFCAGVERAIGIVDYALEQVGEPVYVRKQIVHNSRVVAGLAERGAVFVDELTEVPDDALVVFSAHGISPAVREEADRRGLRSIDATCPLVAKVHAEARRFAAEGYLVVLIGHAGHEEVEGTLGEAPESMALVSDPADVDSLAPADPEKVVYLMQTTLSPDDAAEVTQALRQRFPAARDPGSDDICYATANRQDALRAIAAKSDLVLVAGSPASSNSLRLVETAERAGTPAYLIEGPGDIELAWLSGAATIGITAGASTPPRVVTEIVTALSGLGPVEVTEHVTAIESIQFSLPKEARQL